MLVGAGICALLAGSTLGAGRRRIRDVGLLWGATPRSLGDLSGDAGHVLVSGELRVDTPAADPFPDETLADAALVFWDHEEGLDRTHAAGLASGRVALDDGTGLAVLDADWLADQLAVAPDGDERGLEPWASPHVSIERTVHEREWSVEDALPADLSRFLDARGVDPHPYRSQRVRYRRVLDGDRVTVAAEFASPDGRPTLRGTDETPLLLASEAESLSPTRSGAVAVAVLLAGVALGLATLWLAGAGIGLF